MGFLTYSSYPTSRHYGPLRERVSREQGGAEHVDGAVCGKTGGIKVLAAEAGFCATGFTGDPEVLRKLGATEPEVESCAIAAVVKGERDADVGKVCGVDGICPW